MKKSKSGSNVRIGVIGVGGMGSNHARSLQEGKVPGAVLAAVADSFPANLAKWDGVPQFGDATKMMKSGLIDAVLIVTPHFSHAPLSIAAMKAGLHVLVEKPITVRKADAEKIIAQHKKSKTVFGIMFNQRTDPLYIQVHKWINDGTLGKIQRISWIATDWFRPQAYFGSGTWRGTWAGEGGGILMNQSPHNLDLWQWFFGMPEKVRAVGGCGRYHKIEVDDDVTAVMEYASGATAVFVVTTGEAPGVNRLEIASDKGLVVVEGRTVRLKKNEVPTSKFTRETKEPFAKSPSTETVLEFPDNGPQHAGIIKNFVEAIQTGKPLIAPGPDGIRALELANALTVAMIEDRPVKLPMKAAVFSKVLDALIKKNQKKTKAKK